MDFCEAIMMNKILLILKIVQGALIAVAFVGSVIMVLAFRELVALPSGISFHLLMAIVYVLLLLNTAVMWPVRDRLEKKVRETTQEEV